MKKPCLKKVSPNPQSSFSVRVSTGINLVNHFHFHSEMELVMVKNTLGNLFISDKYVPFKAGDVFLLGANLPHSFIHDFKWSKDKDLIEEAIAIHFGEKFLGNCFMQLPEMEEIDTLFCLAKKGLQLFGSLKTAVQKRMEEMVQASSLEKLLLHLEILMLVAKSDEYIVLGVAESSCLEVNANEKRIEKVYEFTKRNYNREINIDEVAMIVGLTKESFCRLFKSITRKTYFQYLIEFRIGKACKLLLENDYSIKEIAYKCGYENLSNFHHQFKKVIFCSPVQYQNKMYHGIPSVGGSRNVFYKKEVA